MMVQGGLVPGVWKGMCVCWAVIGIGIFVGESVGDMVRWRGRVWKERSRGVVGAGESESSSEVGLGGSHGIEISDGEKMCRVGGDGWMGMELG